MSLSWTIGAQSREELLPIYQKLNYLVSTLAPTYTPKGYMTGNLVQLTIGGYLYEQVGIIKGLTVDLQEDSPWEIAIDDKGKTNDKLAQLPHIIRVTGFSFTPIHNFLARRSFGVGATSSDYKITPFITPNTSDNKFAING
jgi:hypothetical protein